MCSLVFYACIWTPVLHHICVCVGVCVLMFILVFMVRRWGANNGAPNSFKRRKSNNINKTADIVTRVTFAVTGDRHRRATQSSRISLKSASNCAAGLEVLPFLPLGVAVGQMHSAFSETLARIRPISWTGGKDNHCWFLKNPVWMQKCGLHLMGGIVKASSQRTLFLLLSTPTFFFWPNQDLIAHSPPNISFSLSFSFCLSHYCCCVCVSAPGVG